MFGYNPFEHLATTLSDAGVLTITNNTNIGNFEPFYLRLRENLTSVVTGEPVLYQVTVNGSNVYLKSIWGTYIPTNRLKARIPYIGRYIVPSEGNPYVVLTNVQVASTDTSLAPTTTTEADNG